MLNEPSDAPGQRLLNRLVVAALPELLTSDDNGNTILNIATLQRMMIFQLQVDILDKMTPLVKRRFEGKNPLKDESLRKNLTDYGDSFHRSICVVGN